MNYDLQLTIHESESNINRDLATVYTKEKWFLILLSQVYFGDLVTEIYYVSPLNSNNSAQLRTTKKMIFQQISSFCC